MEYLKTVAVEALCCGLNIKSPRFNLLIQISPFYNQVFVDGLNRGGLLTAMVSCLHYPKIPIYADTRKIDVIILKFEQFNSIIELR